MSAKNEQTLRRLVSSIKQADRPKTSGYDTQATVRRIEDGIAWVHIPGGVDETPVKLTIAAAPGDTVQVRVAGGRAFLVGNATAPPTDDTTAKKAVSQIGAVGKAVKAVRQIAERAAKIAGDTNQYFWHTQEGTDTGAHITEIPQEDFLRDPENGGGNLLLRSIGVAIRDGLTELAQFSIAGLKLFSESGVEFTNIGYGLVKTTSDDEEIEGPYYTFGTRDGGDIGYLSAVIGGGRATVYRAVAMCGGSATGLSSMACGSGATANSADQVVFGRQNVPDTSDKYVFIIGNGTPSAPSNALVVDWDGNLECNNIGKTLSASASKAITTAGIDTYTEGPSVTLTAGVWVVNGQWVFNTGSSTGARNLGVQLSPNSGSTASGAYKMVRVFAANNSFASLEITDIITLTTTTTVYLKGASSMTYTTAAHTAIKAVRIK